MNRGVWRVRNEMRSNQTMETLQNNGLKTHIFDQNYEFLHMHGGNLCFFRPVPNTIPAIA